MSDVAEVVFRITLLILIVVVGGWLTQRKDRRRTRQQPVRYCPRCGHPNPPSVTFCESCNYLFPSPGQPVPPITRSTTEQTPNWQWTAADDRRHIRWLLDELERPELIALLTPASIETLKQHYQDLLQPPVSARPVVPGLVEPDIAPAVAMSSESPLLDVIAEESLAPTLGVAEVSSDEPIFVGPSTITPRPTQAVLPTMPSSVPPPPVGAMREPFRVPQPWKEWDSAVILLYLGAFLIVAAGLVYSSYSWERLGGWQKIGLLVVTTLSFTGGGLALLPFRRVRPAAETFIGIGAFLLPMNAIATINFGGDRAAEPSAVGEIGAVIVTILYAFFSFRPGGIVYRYATVVSGLIAIALLPNALGVALPWGAPLVVAATVFLGDGPSRLRGRWRRFAAPVVHVGLVALPVATVAGVAARWDGSVASWWIAVVSLATAAISVGRLGLRRGDDWLFWVWTGIVLGGVATTVAALDWSRDNWGIACLIVVIAWLVLGERGPELVRRSRNRTVLHVEAGLLLMLAPIVVNPDSAALRFTLSWLATAVGFAALARLHNQPWLGALAALQATIAYLSLNNLIDTTDLVGTGLIAPLLAPAPLLLACAALAIGRTHDWEVGRRWSLPIWGVAACEAIAVSAFGCADVLDDLRAETYLWVAAVFASFAVAGLVGVSRTHWSIGLVAVALWVEGATVLLLLAFPVSEGRRLPLLLLAHLGLAGLAVRVRFDPTWDHGRERRWSTVGYLVLAGLALAAMFAIAAPYVFDPARPPDLTSHPATSWWWPYLLTFGLLAVIGYGTGRLRTRHAVWMLTIGLTGFAFLGLRMAYGATSLDAWRWPPLVVALAGTGTSAVVLWRPLISFDAVARRHLIGVLAGLVGLPALVLMTGHTIAYALDRDRDLDLVEHLAARWWWPDLVAALGLIVGGWWLGQRRQVIWCAPVAAAGLVIGEILGLRMLYGNLALDGRHWWALIGGVGLASAVAVWFATRERAEPSRFSSVLQQCGVVASGLIGLPTAVAMTVASVGYAIDLDAPYTLSLSERASWWWPFVAFYLVATVTGCVIGPRLRRFDLAAPTAVSGLAGLLLLGRITYAVTPFDPLTWLPMLVAFGAIVAVCGLGLRQRRTARFWQRLGAIWAGAGTGLGLIGLVGSLAITIGYLVDVSVPFTVSHAGDSGWWWRFLLLYLALTGVSGWVGRRTDRAAAGPVLVGFGMLSALLVLRMITVDLVIWTNTGIVGAVVLAALRPLGIPRPSTVFTRSVRRSLDVAVVGVGVTALLANLGFGVAGESDPVEQMILYGLLAAVCFGCALWQRQPLLVYGSVAALVIAVGFWAAVVDSGAVRIGYVYAGIAWVLVGASIAVPADRRWTGQRLVWERSAYAVACLPVLLGIGRSGAFDPGEAAYQQLTAAIFSVGGVIAVIAYIRRSARRGYAASVILLLAGLMQIAATKPENVQAYTVPIALYLLGLGWLHRADSDIFNGLVSASAGLLMVPAFAQSLSGGGYHWALLCGAEGLAFVFFGLISGRRTPTAVGVVGVTAIVLRLTVDYVHSLPTWAILAVVGATLLGLGTFWLAAQEEITRRFDEGKLWWRNLR